MKKNEQLRTLTEEEADDIRSVMRMEAGRRFVSRILGKARIYETSFAGQNEQTNFNEGMRNVGLMILAECEEAAPREVITMMSEEQDGKRRERERAAAADDKRRKRSAESG